LAQSRKGLAEVGALLSVVTGQKVNLDTEGRLVFRDGRLGGTLATKVALAFGGTTVDAQGSLTVTDGKPEVAASLKTLFPQAGTTVGASLTVRGADQVKVDLKLSALGEGTRLETDGTLTVGRRSVSAGLTTSLVATAQDACALAVGGLVTVSDEKQAVDLNAKLSLGVFRAVAGVGTQATVERYQPDASDPRRTDIEGQGGVWAVRTTTVEAKGEVGAQVVLGAGFPRCP